MNHIKKFIITLHQKALSNPTITRAFHTFVQAFLGVFLVGVSPILNDITNHKYADAKVALFALCGAALAAAISAVKNQVWPIIVSWAAQDEQHFTIPTDFIGPRDGTGTSKNQT